MTRRAILHIGAEKTGTTTLQTAFCRDAARLADLGVRYPDLGGASHAALVYAAADADTQVADLAPHIGLMPGESRDAFVRRLEERLAAEIAAHPGARFVFSTEHAQSRLVSAASLQQLHALLARYFDTVDVAVYLRRWDRMAMSFHATAMRNGPAPPFSFARFAGSTLLDYPQLLDRWARVFGEEHVHVGIFHRPDLINGSILDDFTTRFGLPALTPVDDQNVSLDPSGQAVLRVIDKALADLPKAKQLAVREAVAETLRADRASALPVARDQAMSFVQGYARDEAEICRRWFPDRLTLFDDRFDDYPERSEPAVRTWRDASVALIDALLGVIDREAQSRAETRYYRALHHRRGNRIDLAEAEIREAVLLRPQSADYWNVLADILHGAGRIEDARDAVAAGLREVPGNAHLLALRDELDLK